MTARLLGLALSALLVAGAAGCGSSPDTVAPSGVDGLVVPTPSPDPDDFVAGIDNPWLPLQAGDRWTRRVADGDTVLAEEVEVLAGTREVAGVEATVVRTRQLDDEGQVLDSRERWFAQDRDGNVWALGELGVWEAGVDGAMAGLAMTRRPRLGDGHVLAVLPDGTELTVSVGEVGESAQVGAERYRDLLHTVERSSGETGESDVYHARGVGEVLRLDDDGVTTELVEHRRAG